MRRLSTLVLCLGLVAAPFHRAHAACRWTYVEGKPQQACDSALDPPATNLPRLSPAPPPSPPRVEVPAAPPPRSFGCSPVLSGCR